MIRFRSPKTTALILCRGPRLSRFLLLGFEHLADVVVEVGRLVREPEPLIPVPLEKQRSLPWCHRRVYPHHGFMRVQRKVYGVRGTALELPLRRDHKPGEP